MAENTNTERADFEAWAISQKLGEYTAQMGFRYHDAGNLYPAWQAWQARASLSLPAAGQEPVAHLWQHSETGRTRVVMPDMIVDADASWQVVGPLYLGAAPQPAVAAGWMPIETAPRDGQAILVSEGRFCYCVEWNEEFDWWAVDDNKLGPFRLRGSAPTHWMPLPPAPSTEGESNG